MRVIRFSPGWFPLTLSWPGVALAAGLGLAVLAPLALARRRWPAIALPAAVISALAFYPSIALFQVPIQRWLVMNLGRVPAVIASGLAQEPVKAAVALVAVLLAGRGRRPARTWLAVGLAAGLGYGVMEAAIFLSLMVPYLRAGLSAAALLPAVERVGAIALHLSLTGLVLVNWARGRGRGWAALLLASLYHGGLNCAVVSCHGGSAAVAQIVLFVLVLPIYIAVWIQWKGEK